MSSDDDGLSDDELTLDDMKSIMAADDVSSNNIGPVTTMPWGTWSSGDTADIKVRGLSYLKADGSKIKKASKVAAGEAMFELIHVDIVPNPDGLFGVQHIASQEGGFMQQQLEKDRKEAPDGQLKPFQYIVVSFMVPNNPGLNLVLYWRKNAVVIAKYPQFQQIWEQFTTSDDDWKDEHIKFVPNVVEGNWLVKKGVGNKPAIIGKKLTQYYHSDAGQNYIEVDIDVGSSKVARSLLNLVNSYTKSLVIEFFFLLESKSLALLPEKLIGGVRLANVDITKFTKLSTASSTSGNSSSVEAPLER